MARARSRDHPRSRARPGVPDADGPHGAVLRRHVPFDQQLPQWEPCTEIADESLRAQFPLQLTNTRTRFRIHNQFYDSDWLQLMYEPLVMLNPADMASRGLETGDVVRVFNDRGEFKVHAAANNAIRPGSVRIYEAATADYTVAGNLQNVTNNTMIERGLRPHVRSGDPVLRHARRDRESVRRDIMTRLAIAINLDRCVGCHTCALSCKMQNNVPEGMLWNRVLTEDCDVVDGRARHLPT